MIVVRNFIVASDVYAHCVLTRYNLGSSRQRKSIKKKFVYNCYAKQILH